MKWSYGALVAVVIALLVANGAWRDRAHEPRQDDSAAPSAHGLPAEAEQTLHAILAGGPFPYDRDGAVFQNREGLLPQRPRGWYHEYTVDTPGSSDRGARRIVTGGDPPSEFFYTDDHYRSFRRLEDPRR